MWITGGYVGYKTGTAGAGFYCQLYNHAHTTHTIICTWLVEGHIEKLNRIICVNVDKVVTRKNFIIIIISDVFILTSVNVLGRKLL